MTHLRAPLLLVASHVAALALGIVGGLVCPIDAKEGWASASQVLATFPETEAAELAFRFGTPEHARVLLEAMPVPRPEDAFYDSVTALRALRLAVVYERLGSLEREQAMLKLLRKRCVERGWSQCAIDDIRHAARAVAKQSAR